MKMPLIFLDSGDTEETKTISKELGTLDGQTTNPSLIASSPALRIYQEQGKKLSTDELLKEYKHIVSEIQTYTKGPVSVEVFADWNTPSTELLTQARDIMKWGKNIYVKFPAIPHGLEAAHQFIKEGGLVNMTLVFDQKQAAAVYSATRGAKTPAFISPFIGRWDDRGYRGLDFLRNIVDMYTEFDSELGIIEPHIKILAASVRSLNELYGAAQMGADIITTKARVIEEWIKAEKPNPNTSPFQVNTQLQEIPSEFISYTDEYHQYTIPKVHGSLLDEGLRKFIKDWKSLIS